MALLQRDEGGEHAGRPAAVAQRVRDVLVVGPPVVRPHLGWFRVVVVAALAQPSRQLVG